MKMNNILSPQQAELYSRIDEILFYKWDPISISNSYWARDEYISYLPQVFKLALESNNSRTIANYLTIITTENMCLPEENNHDLYISNLILEIKEGIGL
jgi:hypothetical protein